MRPRRSQKFETGVALLIGLGAVAASARREPELISRDAVSLPGTHESVSACPSAGRALLTRCAADFTGCRILEAQMEEGAWRVIGAPAFVPSTPAAGAVLLRGASTAYYHSTPILPGEGSGRDWKIWEAVRAGGGWRRRRLPAPVNTVSRECCVAAAGGGRFYFASDRDGSWQIFRASAAPRGAWTVEKLPPEINASPSGQWPSFVDQEERTLLFSSIRKEGLGGDDVYVASRTGQTWAPARLLPSPVNSPAFEDGARLSADGRRLFWSSTRPLPSGDRSSNVYSIEVGSLLAPAGSPSGSNLGSR